MPPLQGLHRFRSDAFKLLVHALCVSLAEVVNQKGNVFGALAQGRNGDGEDFEAVVEVAAELLVRDHFGQVPVGRGHQANIHRNGARASQPLELLLLEGSQKLGLQLQRNVSDLVEEKAAVVRQFKAADLLHDGSGEGALLVPEQLALQQSAGYGGAIQPYKRMVPAGAQSVDGASDQLLAGAGLPLDQHGRVGVRHGFDLLENPFKRRALTDDLVEVACKLFFEIELLLGQRSLLLGQLILQLGDLVKGLRVIDGQGDLVGHLPEQSEVQKAPPLISHKLGGRDLVRARRA